MLAPWKESYDKPRQYIKRQRHYLNVHLVKAMVFPVIIHRCESWIIKKAEHWKIDPFELWCWRRLLRIPWRARQSILSILKEINPEYSLEGLMLKLKLQYFGHWMQKTSSLEKTLIRWKIKRRRINQRQRMRQLNDITDSMDMSLCKLQERVKHREAWCAALLVFSKTPTWLSNWTATNNEGSESDVLLANSTRYWFGQKVHLVAFSVRWH